MNHLCDNPQCDWYDEPLPESAKAAEAVTIRVDRPEPATVTVHRYQYMRREGKSLCLLPPFFLCSTCHHAVEMVVSPTTLKGEHK